MDPQKPPAKHTFIHLTLPHTLFSSPVLDLVTSRVMCGRTGVERDIYRLEFPRWVNIIACTDNHELIMIRQYRYGSDKVELEIPGGAVNVGESPLHAGLRELLEETGFGGNNGQIIGKVRPNPAIQSNSCYTVLIENVKQIHQPSFDEMEDIEVLRLPEDEIFALIGSGNISHGLVLNGLMFYAMHRQKKFW